MSDQRGIELYCRRCGSREWTPRPSPEQACACGAGLYRRAGEPPKPATHWPQVVRSFVTLRGALFFGGVALVGALPVGLAQRLAAILVYVAAIKMATRAMKVSRSEPIQFPEVSADELFDVGALVPALVFVLLFTWAPPILLAFGASGALDLSPEARSRRPLAAASYAVDVPAPPGFDLPGQEEGAVGQRLFDDEAGDTAAQADDDGDGGGVAGLIAMLVGLLLLAWAPMALVLYLRTGTTFGFFHVPAGLAALRHDPLGYLALAALVLPTLGARFVCDLLQAALPFFLAPPVVAAKAAAIIAGWGIAGLYVRQHARAYDMPIDEDDWVLFTRFPAAAPPPAARARPTSIDLDTPAAAPAQPVVRGALLEGGDELPVVAGRLDE